MRVLYHLPLSPYSRKIRLVLAERRLTFELKLERPWDRRQEYLDMNPAGTVPTLVEENGLVIPDSNVICEYLEEAYPDSALMGRTLAERVEVRRLIAWFDGRFAREVTDNLLGEKYLKRRRPRPSGLHRAARRLRQPEGASRLCRLAGGDAEMARRQRALARRLRGRRAFVRARLHRRGGLVGQRRGARLVCTHEKPAMLSLAAGGSRGWGGSAGALCGPGFLGRTCSFLKKRTKKLLLLGIRGQFGVRRVSKRAKVSCFFFSKKKAFLPE
jgi:glutathione S-transferase